MAETSPTEFAAMLGHLAPKLRTGPEAMSEKEVEGLQKMLQDPGMMKELQNYMDEMSDPKVKAETEEWIRQEEKRGSLPAGKSLIHPKAGFSFLARFKKGTLKAGQPLVINVVRSDEMEECELTPAADGMSSVKLPATAGPMRMEKGPDLGPKVGLASDDVVGVVDVCVHTQAVARSVGVAATSKQWRQLLVEVALEQADRRAQVDISSRGVGVMAMQSGEGIQKLTQLESADKCRDLPQAYTASGPVPPTMMVPKEEKAGSLPEKSEPQSKSSKSSAAGAAGSKAAALPSKQAEQPSTKPLAELFPMRKGPDGVFTRAPAYRVVERNPFELGSNMQSGNAGTLGSGMAASMRPRELKLEIVLPGVEKVSEIEIDIHEREVSITDNRVFTVEPALLRNSKLDSTAAAHQSPLPFRYHGICNLSYPVSTGDEDAMAKWDKSTCTLTVTLKVLPPPQQKLSSTTAVSSVDEAEVVVEKQFGQPKQAKPTTSTAKHVPADKLPEVHSHWVKERVDGTGSTAQAALAQVPGALTPAIASPTKLAADDGKERAGGEPPFRWRQTGDQMNVLFDIPHVIASSAEVEWADVQGTGEAQTAGTATYTFRSPTSPVEVAALIQPSGPKPSNGACAGTEFVYSVQLRLTGRVLTSGKAGTRIDVTNNNVAAIMIKAANGKWAALVRGPPEGAETPAVTPASGPEVLAPPPVPNAAATAVPLASPVTKPVTTASVKPKGMDTDRVTAGHAPPAPVQQQEEEVEVFELGPNGSYDIPTRKPKMATPVPKAAPVPVAAATPVKATATPAKAAETMPVPVPAPAPAPMKASPARAPVSSKLMELD